MKKFIIYILTSCFGLALLGQSTNQNYIRTRTYTSADAAKFLDKVQYYDGLGRLTQDIQVGITIDGNNLATLKEYDAFGREGKTWTPVITGGGAQYYPDSYLKGEAIEYYNDQSPFSEPIYEASPLNRVLEQYGPGSAWRENGGKSVKTAYMTNNNTYKCIRFSVGQNGGNYFLNHGWYPNGELFVTEMKDEDGKISYEFKNKLGQVVLTRQMDGNVSYNTHYIYDDFGNLCYVLPPILSDQVIDYGVSKLDTGTEVMQYAYIYKYDERNRCIKKKLPGCDWISYRYDEADQLIYSQDGEQRKRPTKMGQDPEGIWTFTIYDAFNRVVLTGESEWPSYSINNFVCTAYYDPTADSYNHGYRHGLGLNYRDYQAVNYYDNYDFLKRDGFKNLNYISKEGFNTRHGDNNDLIAAKGLLTGSAVKILGSNSYIYTAFYYDKKGRLIQTVSTNHIGGIDKTFMAYNFSGQPVKQYVQHTGNFLFNITELTEDYAYAYDHAGRLKTTTRNGVVIESLSYNELGQVEGKKQGTSFDAKYTYNIRGWITQQKDNGGSKFQMDLKYQDGRFSWNGAPYNGNISEIIYAYGGQDIVTAYQYDNLNRLTISDSGFDEPSINGYSEWMDYDKNGNLKYIQRNSTFYKTTDNIDFAYNGNQLKTLSNRASDINGSKVVEYPAETAIFSYNANGALTSDSGRGIDSIKYNSLNLPQRIKFNNGNLIEYTYSASGEKLKAKYTTAKQTVTQPLTNDTRIAGITLPPISVISQTRIVDYIGNIIAESNIQSLVEDKLTVLFNGGYEEHWKSRLSIIGQEPIYEINTYFQMKDYLGNIRDVKREGSSDIVQRTEYLPFGTPFKQEVGDAGAQRYKFGGKEFDQMHGLNMYDFHARQYDPLLGRFHTVDPMAEKYYSISPYVYCANNPVLFVDPTGEYIWIYYQDENDKQQKIKFDPNQTYKGNNQFIKDFYEAYNVLKDAGFDMEIFDSFVDDDLNSISVAHTVTENRFAPNWDYRLSGKTEQSVGTVFWRSDKIMEIKENGKKGRTSPALTLVHEFGHGYGFRGGILDPLVRMNQKVDYYVNAEEEHVITTYEHPAAEKLGQYKRTTAQRKKIKYVKGTATGVKSIITKEEAKKNRKK